MPLHRALLTAMLLWLMCCAPARAGWLQRFVHIACMPEIGVLHIEHLSFEGAYFLSDGLASGKAAAKASKAWERHGFFEEDQLDKVCKLPRATYTIRLRRLPEADHGMCSAAPSTLLTLSINGKPLLNKVVFGEDCAYPPSVRKLDAYDGSRNNPEPTLSVCIDTSPFNGPTGAVCRDLSGAALEEAVPLDDIGIRDYYEAARSK